MEKRATIKDVANLAGVSFTLVSKYLNRNPGARMSEDTRARIDDAIRQLDYHPSAMARALRSGHSHTIGMVCGGLTNAYFAHAANCALREFQKHGYQLLLALAEPDSPETALRTLTEHNVDGIYGFAMPKTTASLTAVKCPMLMNHVHALGVSEVCIDAAEPLAAGLAALECPRVEGLFVKPTYWIQQFRNACEDAGCAGVVHALPVDTTARREAVGRVCEQRPQGIFTNGWETMSLLLEVLSEEYPDYRPRLLLHANCTGPFLGDERIVGVIMSSTRLLIEKSCEALVKQIECVSAVQTHATIPSRFIHASTPEYQTLVTRHFQLT